MDDIIYTVNKTGDLFKYVQQNNRFLHYAWNDDRGQDPYWDSSGNEDWIYYSTKELKDAFRLWGETIITEEEVKVWTIQ
jgi:hypothetical protein